MAPWLVWQEFQRKAKAVLRVVFGREDVLSVSSCIGLIEWEEKLHSASQQGIDEDDGTLSTHHWQLHRNWTPLRIQ